MGDDSEGGYNVDSEEGTDDILEICKINDSFSCHDKI